MVVYVYKCKATGEFFESNKLPAEMVGATCPNDGSLLEYVGEMPE